MVYFGHARRHTRRTCVSLRAVEGGETETCLTVTVRQIIAAVAEEFGVTTAELTGRSREARCAVPRALAVQISRQFTNASYQALGRALGGRHHSTILSAERRSHDLMDAQPELYDRRQAILRKLDLTDPHL